MMLGDASAVHPSADGTYYGRPTIKEPVWIWSVPAYFYAGGAAGAAAVLGAVVQVLDGRGSRGLVRRCRGLAASGAALGAALLVHDLGRRERFLNMLRVFRPTSAMSMGSWVLAGSTGTAAGAVALDRLGARRLASAAGLASGVLGVPLSGYTAVLLADTAVPVWQSARRALPPLFVSSAIASAASLLELAPLAPHEEAVVRRFGLVGKAAELAAMRAVERDTARPERLGAPLREGLAGVLWKAARVLTGAGLATSLVPVPVRWRRSRAVVSSVLGTGGALSMRFAVFHAGRASARDPRATFETQRRSAEHRGRGGGHREPASHRWSWR